MRNLKHPIAVFVMAVFAVIGIGVGIVAMTTTSTVPRPSSGRSVRPPESSATILALAKLGTKGPSLPSINSAAPRHRCSLTTPSSRSRKGHPQALFPRQAGA